MLSREFKPRYAGMSGPAGTLAQAQALLRAVATPATGESKGAAMRRAAEAAGLPLTKLRRLVYGEDGISPMTAHALIADGKRILRAELAQKEAERLALERHTEELRRRLAALEDGGGCDGAPGNGGGGGGCGGCCSGPCADAPTASRPCSGAPAGSPGGSTRGRSASRASGFGMSFPSGNW